MIQQARWLRVVHMARDCFFFVVLSISAPCSVVFVWQVEMDPFCVRVLKARMADGVLPTCGISNDVLSFDPAISTESARAQVVTAGFPCQAGFWQHLETNTLQTRVLCFLQIPGALLSRETARFAGCP